MKSFDDDTLKNYRATALDNLKRLYRDILENDAALERGSAEHANDPVDLGQADGNMFFGAEKNQKKGRQRAYSSALKKLVNQRLQLTAAQSPSPTTYKLTPEFEAAETQRGELNRHAEELDRAIRQQKEAERKALPKSKYDYWDTPYSGTTGKVDMGMSLRNPLASTYFDPRGNQGSDRNEIAPPEPGDPFNPNLFATDDGRVYDLEGVSSKAYAEKLIKDRRRKLGEPEKIADMGWDGFFGALAGKENAAKAQGKNFKVDYAGKGPGTGTGFGTWKALDVPSGRVYNQHTSDRQSDEGAHVPMSEIAPGRRGRENMGLAELQGLDPNQGGYYTPEEHDAMTGRKWSPLTMLQGLYRR